MSGLTALYQSARDTAVRLKEFVVENRGVYDAGEDDDDALISRYLDRRQELIDELTGYQDKIRSAGETADERDEKLRLEIRAVLNELTGMDEEDKVKLRAKMENYNAQSKKLHENRKLFAYMDHGYIGPQGFDVKR